ncbi:MAG: FAD-dependent oxidoreductase, partial [Armatimonadota bacterium]|nr:FAD-dependent oxidoreductase [Armatimonadota bacterium]
FTQHAVVLLAKRDGRVFFVVPWFGFSLVGTTDTDYEESPDHVAAQSDEIAYLVEETRRVFPGAAVERVLYTMAGVRALVRSRRSAALSESAVSRKHRLYDHAADGIPGLLSLFGGKITSYRAIAEETVDLVARQLGNTRPCRTAWEPLYGGGDHPDSLRPRIRAWAKRLGLSSDQADYLLSFYGTRAADVLALAEENPELRQQVAPAYPDIRAQVQYAVETEGARSTADVLLRRTGLAYAADRGAQAVDPVSRDVGQLLGWNAAQQERDRAHALQQIEQILGSPNP